MISEFIFYIHILHEITLQLFDSQGIVRAKEFWQFKYLIAVISCRNSKLLNPNVVVEGSSIKPHRKRRPTRLGAQAILGLQIFV